MQMISFLSLLVAPAAGHVWDGTFSGNHLHKSLQVCVDCDSTACYGQGLVDERAYLRGTITEAQGVSTWTGNYYEPGKGSATGKFSLKLDTQGKYTGKFTSDHDSDLSSDTAVTGSRTTSTVPADAECFRADLDYLKDETKGFVNGFVEPTALYPTDFKSFADNAMTGSYSYIPDDSTVRGTQNGNCYLGTTQWDVCTITWYETGPAEGISLLVAKNATHHYETWYYVASLSLFDPTHIDDESDCYHNQHSAFIQQQDISKPDQSLTRSGENVCFALWTVVFENACNAKQCADLPSCTQSGDRRLESGCIDKSDDGTQCISKPTDTKPTETTETKEASGAKRVGLMLTLGLGVIPLV